jgi:hypothetical protein
MATVVASPSPYRPLSPLPPHLPSASSPTASELCKGLGHRIWASKGRIYLPSSLLASPVGVAAYDCAARVAAWLAVVRHAPWVHRSRPLVSYRGLLIDLRARPRCEWRALTLLPSSRVGARSAGVGSLPTSEVRWMVRAVSMVPIVSAAPLRRNTRNNGRGRRRLRSRGAAVGGCYGGVPVGRS